MDYFFVVFLAYLTEMIYLYIHENRRNHKTWKNSGVEIQYKNCYQYDLRRDFVVFDGVNGQRFSIDGQKMNDDEILEHMGDALKLVGRRQLKLELESLLNIMSDN